MLANSRAYRNAQFAPPRPSPSPKGRATVKLHLSTAAGNVITASGAGWVRIGTREYRASVVVTVDTVADWAPAGFEALAEDDFARLLVPTRPDVVLLGTGATIRFPHPRLTRALADAGVGVEVMDTAAACRTYNILVAEGRRVVAALVV
jgi:uncharacterized protein